MVLADVKLAYKPFMSNTDIMLSPTGLFEPFHRLQARRRVEWTLPEPVQFLRQTSVPGLDSQRIVCTRSLTINLRMAVSTQSFSLRRRGM